MATTAKMPSALDAPYSRLESLHTELLEIICGYVARMSDLTYRRPRCQNEVVSVRCDTPGRQDLKALRLVSRRFATLQTPCEGLFRDFHLLVTEDSLTRLENIASHPRLRSYVSRVTFFQPLFWNSLTNEDVFYDSLYDQVNQTFHERLANGGWSNVEKTAMAASLMDHCYPYSDSQVCMAQRSYAQLYRRQQNLLKDANVSSRIAKALSSCSRITSAFLVLRDPCRSQYYNELQSIDYAQRNSRPDWMTTYYPDVLHRTCIIEPGETGRSMKRNAHNHFSWVTNILAQTTLQLHELVTDDHNGFDPTFDWTELVGSMSDPTTKAESNSALLDVSQLRRLHVNPLTLDGELSDHDWSACLMPLLLKTPKLSELSLRFGSMQADDEDLDFDALDKHHRPPSFSEFFNLQFPRLRDLHLDWLRFPGTQMAEFIRTHSALTTIALGSVFAEDSAWKSVFDAVKGHPRISNVEMCDLRRAQPNVSEEVCVSGGCHWSPKPSQAQQDLTKYVTADGCWTAALGQQWEIV